MNANDDLRLDKWLWAARFFKTRSAAAQAITGGKIELNGDNVKPARRLALGDRLRIRLGPFVHEVVVKELTASRGPAAKAQLMYEETPESLAAREQAAEQRRLGAEPALGIAHGRPTKRDRREIERKQVDWQRWSASVDSDRQDR